NPTSTIRFGVPKASEVQLIVYNMLGQKVKVLVDRQMQAGWHSVKFDASSLSSGTYVYRIKAGDFVQTRKMMLIK
ncbi:MAG TPA: peptidase S8, partial [Balneolaceae bacterium]|nr:peptidase S8 [Balneolaceae bacterium]